MRNFIVEVVETITKVHLYEVSGWDEESVREGILKGSIPVRLLTTYQPSNGSNEYIKEIRRA